MIGIEGKSPTECELRRMSVLSSARRGGVGRLLYNELEKFARQFGYKIIRLGSGSLPLDSFTVPTFVGLLFS